ncbi:uncharacterized protein [Apostichopus japonicus]|uniref:uncharacterized protein n=1 Tax=Stichopus japonicus TaxID=307972 RepID=UPI003AB2300A
MNVQPSIPKIAVCMVWLVSYAYFCESQEIIAGLRYAKNFGPSGRFLVQRSHLEDAIQELGLEGMVQLLTSSEYDDTIGEVAVQVQSCTDLTIADELSTSQQDQISTSGTVLFIGLPVVSSDSGAHLLISMAYLTDAAKPLLIPYMTSADAIQYIDSIEMGEDYIILRDNDDVMRISVYHDQNCVDNEELGKDLDNFVGGHDVRLSNYPAKFDWGCDSLRDDVSFCEVLDPFMCAIQSTNGNVCTTMSTTLSRRCLADMEIVEMTGVFEEAAPFLASKVPTKSFEAGWIIREHGVGIVFPCF